MCREEQWQRHPQESAYALIAPEDSRLQPVRRRLHLLRELENLLTRRRQAVTRRQLLEHLRPEAFLKLSDASQHGRVVHTEALRSEERRVGKESVSQCRYWWSP